LKITEPEEVGEYWGFSCLYYQAKAEPPLAITPFTFDTEPAAYDARDQIVRAWEQLEKFILFASTQEIRDFKEWKRQLGQAFPKLQSLSRKVQ
jgi:hypothetical protein